MAPMGTTKGYRKTDLKKEEPPKDLNREFAIKNDRIIIKGMLTMMKRAVFIMAS
jgi:hypothetical protein